MVFWMIIYFHRLLNPRLLEYLRSTWYLLSGIQGALPTWSLTDSDRVPRPSRQDGCIPALFYSTSSSLFDPFYSLPTDQIPLIVVGGRLENRRLDILIYRTPPTGRVSVTARVRLVSSFPHYLFLFDSLESLIFLFLLSSSSLCLSISIAQGTWLPLGWTWCSFTPPPSRPCRGPHVLNLHSAGG